MNTYKLRAIGACAEALDWAEAQKGRKQAWADCARGDWMLWLLGKLSGKPESESRKKLVSCCCACARLALPYAPEWEKRPLKAIETAEAWTRGEATLAEVISAAFAAYAAASSVAFAAAKAAAYVDPDTAANAAAKAAADAADASAAREKTLVQCADIVRGFYPNPPRF